MRPLPFLIAVAVATAAGPVVAAEPAEQPAAQDQAKDPAQKPQTAADKTAAPAKPGAETPKPSQSPADKSTPQRFVPSEQVRADFDVSFPIDT